MVTRRMRKHPLSKVAAFVVMVALNFAYLSPSIAATLKQRHAAAPRRPHAHTGAVARPAPRRDEKGGNPTGYYKATRIEDRNGNAMTFQYNLSVTYPDGSTDKLLTSVTDTVGRTTQVNWTNLGDAQTPAWRVTSIVDPIGRQWTYAYNAEKNLSSVTDPANRTVTYTYTSITGALGTETGLLASETSPMGRTASYSYTIDTAPEPDVVRLSRMDEPSGHYVKFSVGGSTEIVGTITDKAPYAGIPYNEILHYSYADLYGRVTAYSEGGLGNADLSWEWNNAFQQVKVTSRLFTAPPTPLVRETELTYDTVFDPQGNVVEPGQGNVVTSKTIYGGQTDTTNLTYYNETKYHQMSTATDPLNRTTQQDYFASDDPSVGNRGNLKNVTDAKGGVTEFTYNAYGQKATMKDAEGRVWSYSYNAHGDLTRLTYPDGSYTETTYDAIGRPTQVRDRKGQITTIQYNVVGQPTRIDYLADNTSVTYAYNNDGQVTSVTDARGTTTYIYEATTGNLLSVTDPVTGTVSYEYLPIGVRSKMTLPNGKFITYTYDFQAQHGFHNSVTINGYWRILSSDPGDVNVTFTPPLKEIVDPDGYKTTITQLNNGAPEVVTADIAKNGAGQTTAQMTQQWSYDEKARLTRVKAFSGTTSGTFLLGYAYDYNALDNRLHMFEIDANNNPTATESYGYDELSRLVSVTYKDGVTQTYTFDKVGNRLTKTEGGNTTTYTYNSVNELTSSSEGSYTYDANGNTLTDAQGRSYVWDQQNHLKQVVKAGTTVNFTYRADGLRARKQVVGGETIDYVYDGQTVIGEIHKDASGNVTKKVWYTPGPNGYISRTETDANENVTNKEWYVYDGLGSCRALVKPNAQGTDAVIVARYDYDVYGAVRTSSGSSANKFKYVAGIGHPTDEETGRFVSEDPGQNTVNWYWYANGNPTRFTDPSGKVSFEGYTNLHHLAWVLGLAFAVASLLPTSPVWGFGLALTATMLFAFASSGLSGKSILHQAVEAMIEVRP